MGYWGNPYSLEESFIVRYLTARLGTRFTRMEVILLVMLVFSVLLPLFAPSRYYVRLVTDAFIFAILALSYDVALGYTGVISLGHAWFFGLGAYAVGILLGRVGLPLPIVVLIVVGMGIAGGIVISVLTLRLKGIYLAMVTLALCEFFYILAQKWETLTGGIEGLAIFLPQGWLTDPILIFYLTLVLLGVIYVFLRRAVNSPVGRVWVAMRENEIRCKHLGYDVVSYKMLSLVLSGALATVAGGLYALSIRFVTPSVFALSVNFQLVLMCIIGGAGTLHGPIIGAIILRLLGPLVGDYTRYWELILGATYLVFVLFFPWGIVRVHQSPRPKFIVQLQRWYGSLRKQSVAKK